MAEAIYYEARGEGERGQEAVAEVILQRTRNGRHPPSVCGVVHEPHQFSYLDDGSIWHRPDAKGWLAANALAGRILKGELVTTFTHRATHYHKVTVKPHWAKSMVKTVRIGHHIFYQPKPQKTASANAAKARSAS